MSMPGKKRGFRKALEQSVKYAGIFLRGKTMTPVFWKAGVDAV